MNGFVLEDDGIVFTQQKYLAKTLLDIGTQFQLLEKYDSAVFYYKKLEDIVSYEDEILDIKHYPTPIYQEFINLILPILII